MMPLRRFTWARTFDFEINSFFGCIKYSRDGTVHPGDRRDPPADEFVLNFNLVNAESLHGRNGLAYHRTIACIYEAVT